jgi:ABC-2 type transport system permease protein
MVVMLIGTTAFAAIGLLIGARGRRLESASGWVSVLMLTQWVFCGVFFSRQIFPASWLPLTDWLPLSPFVDATRAVMLDGSSLVDVVPELAALSGWTIVCGLIGWGVFRAD